MRQAVRNILELLGDKSGGGWIPTCNYGPKCQLEVLTTPFIKSIKKYNPMSSHLELIASNSHGHNCGRWIESGWNELMQCLRAEIKGTLRTGLACVCQALGEVLVLPPRFPGRYFILRWQSTYCKPTIHVKTAVEPRKMSIHQQICGQIWLF